MLNPQLISLLSPHLTGFPGESGSEYSEMRENSASYKYGGGDASMGRACRVSGNMGNADGCEQTALGLKGPGQKRTRRARFKPRNSLFVPRDGVSFIKDGDGAQGHLDAKS